MAEGTRVGFYGDDVTGSLDALLQFRREGWSGALFSLDAVLAGDLDPVVQSCIDTDTAARLAGSESG